MWLGLRPYCKKKNRWKPRIYKRHFFLNFKCPLFIIYLFIIAYAIIKSLFVCFFPLASCVAKRFILVIFLGQWICEKTSWIIIFFHLDASTRNILLNLSADLLIRLHLLRVWAMYWALQTQPLIEAQLYLWFLLNIVKIYNVAPVFILFIFFS